MSSAAPRRHLLPTAVAAAALSLAALLFSAAPASAHDELVSSDPAADAVLDASPARITLTYSADLLDEAGATEVQATDATGASVVDGAPAVSGTDVTQNLRAEASGVITVLWRVVSSDGHPISGQFSFTAPTAPAPTASATPTTTASASSGTAPSAEAAPSPTPSTAPVETASDASPLPWILLAVALALVVGALVWLALSRGRRTPGDDGSRGPGGR